MDSSHRRAVITGLGVVSPIGQTKAEFWASLAAGRGGIKRLQSIDPTNYPCQIGGEIPSFDAKGYLEKKERKSLKIMSRTIQLAVAAAQLAWIDGGADRSRIDSTRFGVEFGAGLIQTLLEELGPPSRLSSDGQPGNADLQTWGAQGLPVMPPLWMLKYLPNMLASHVSILHDAQGPNNSVTQSDVASLLAVGEAVRLLQRDLADIFLVGGADNRLGPLSFLRQSLWLPLSRRNAEPERACRPFDRLRDGIVIGEGAGVLVLEDWEHARRRGARIYAEVVGFASAFDRGRTGAGLARALRGALNEAGVGPEEIDHVNAHGYSSTAGDIQESKGIQEVFGNCSRPVPVLAVKSYIGNLGAGAGTVEMAASLLAQEQMALPGTLNYEEPDPACPVAVATGGMSKMSHPHFVKIGMTEMGQCAALVLRKGHA